MSAARQMTPLRASVRLVLALVYFLVARLMAEHGAHGLVVEDWAPLVEQAMFVFLLLLGFAGLGFVFDRQLEPISEQGLVLRAGWLGETGLGLAFGWGIALACVVPLLLFGGIALHFSWSGAAFGWLLVDAVYFALATLGLQIAFRGYAFQCAIRAIGELPAALVFAILYGILQAYLPGSSRMSMAVSIAFGLLLAMAYLRTRALWLAWGLHFGWVASRALLFGLPVNGVSSHSPVVQGDPLASFSLSGANFGLDGSWVALVAMLLAMPLLYRATRELSFVHNAPVLIPAGMAVDLDAAARSQHEAATREVDWINAPSAPAAPEAKPLVQILPAASPAPLPVAPNRETHVPSSDPQG